MSRPLKCCKLSEVGDQENTDKISSLPDDLLAHLLSFLPTKSAVSTSILSTRWRCLHMLTNCLSFDVPRVCRENEDKSQKKSFKKFVNRVLLLHKVSPIKKFHLNCGQFTYDDMQLHAWVSVALLKRVEQLNLSFIGQFNALPHCLFVCQTIVELKISCIEGFRVPNSIHLPSLKILHLSCINFSDRDSLGKFVSSCSLLQELMVDQCEWPADSDRHICLSSRSVQHLTIIYCKDRFEVDAPNLVYLEYYSTEEVDVALSLKSADRLVEAGLEFTFTDNSDSIQLGLALIKAVYHVKELYLRGNAIQFLTRTEDDQIPLYPNLVKLYLGLCSYDTWKYVTYWLANLPRLETLIFDQGLIDDYPTEKKWPSNVALIPFSSRVKVIEVCDFSGGTNELVLLKYLLKNARILKRLILYKVLENFSRKQELQATKKLLMFPRASKTCVVQLRKEKQ